MDTNNTIILQLISEKEGIKVKKEIETLYELIMNISPVLNKKISDYNKKQEEKSKKRKTTKHVPTILTLGINVVSFEIFQKILNFSIYHHVESSEFDPVMKTICLFDISNDIYKFIAEQNNIFNNKRKFQNFNPMKYSDELIFINRFYISNQTRIIDTILNEKRKKWTLKFLEKNKDMLVEIAKACEILQIIDLYKIIIEYLIDNVSELYSKNTDFYQEIERKLRNRNKNNNDFDSNIESQFKKLKWITTDLCNISNFNEYENNNNKRNRNKDYEFRINNQFEDNNNNPDDIFFQQNSNDEWPSSDSDFFEDNLNSCPNYFNDNNNNNTFIHCQNIAF
jgi:hypothetical protein